MRALKAIINFLHAEFTCDPVWIITIEGPIFNPRYKKH